MDATLRKESPARAGAGLLLNRFAVAGFRYGRGPRLIGRMRAGDPLAMRPEPENPHDPYAVRITWMRWNVGYVPRSDNRAISRLLRQGIRLHAVVLQIDAGTPWRAVRAAVFLPLDGVDGDTPHPQAPGGGRSRRCPSCGGRSIARYLWGMPAMSEELRRELEAGRVILGGCCLPPNEPEWRCTDCGTAWRTTPIDPEYEP